MEAVMNNTCACWDLDDQNSSPAESHTSDRKHIVGVVVTQRCASRVRAMRDLGSFRASAAGDNTIWHSTPDKYVTNATRKLDLIALSDGCDMGGSTGTSASKFD